MNPSGMQKPAPPSEPLKLSPEAEKAIKDQAEKEKAILAEKEKNAHQALATMGHAGSAKAPVAHFLDAPVFDTGRFILSVEEDAIDGKFGHLGVGDYDKLLIEKVKGQVNFVPELDKGLHTLVVQSVKRYAGRTENRIGKK